MLNYVLSLNGMVFPKLWRILFIFFLFLGVAVITVVPAFSHRRIPGKRLKVCADGCELLIYFLISVTASVICLLVTLPMVFADNKMIWLGNLLCVILVEAAVFWGGIIRVYLTSAQIGIKWRTIGLVCGWIPVVHLIVLMKIIRMALAEWEFESGKIMQAQERKDELLCRTRYPILMVHGVFFRDFKYLSDSRRSWQEPVEDIVRSGEYERLHILTHAFWYHEKDEDISRTAGDFIRSANRERYRRMAENITDIESIFPKSEVFK